MLPHPLWGKINPTAIPTLFNFFLNHFLSINLKFGLISEIFGVFFWRGNVWTAILFGGHVIYGKKIFRIIII